MPTKRKSTMTKSAPRSETFSRAKVAAEIRARVNSPLKLRDWLDRYFPFIVGPRHCVFRAYIGAARNTDHHSRLGLFGDAR